MTHKMRLVVFKSNAHIYAQVIDPSNGFIIASASTLEKQFKNEHKKMNIEIAKQVGVRLRNRLEDKGSIKVTFDRGRYKYHGKIKALVDQVMNNV